MHCNVGTISLSQSIILLLQSRGYEIRQGCERKRQNDPNNWSEDPLYILDLVKRIVRVSLETVRIVRGLPELKVLFPQRNYTSSFFRGESIAAEKEGME